MAGATFLSQHIKEYYYEAVWAHDGEIIITFFSRMIIGASIMFIGHILRVATEYARRYFREKYKITGAKYGFVLSLIFLMIGSGIVLNNGLANIRFGYFDNAIKYYVGALCICFGILIIADIYSPPQIISVVGANSLLILGLQRIIVQVASEMITIYPRTIAILLSLLMDVVVGFVCIYICNNSTLGILIKYSKRGRY